MSICTAEEAINAAEYWVGYYEKASSSYAETRDQSAFTKNKGSANYTYFGYLLNYQTQAWCGLFVTTAILEACNNVKADATTVLHGIYPYAAVNQVYEAASSSYKGRAGSFSPKAADIIVFHDGTGYRTHTGLVYSVSGSYVYTIEGNSSDMCQKRSYLLSNTSYIYGYVRPKYAASASSSTTTTTTVEQYGSEVTSVTVHTLSKGTAGPEVKTVQRICYARGIKGSNGSTIAVDGDFGSNTETAVKTLQGQLGLTQDGIVGEKTWQAMLTELD